MLLVVEKGIRGGICNATHWCVNKYMKDYGKTKNPHIITIWTKIGNISEVAFRPF